MSDEAKRTAHFNDGHSTERHHVTLTIEDGTLQIRAADGHQRALWPLDEIRYAAKPTTGQSLRLRLGETDARLSFKADDDTDWLTSVCPNLGRRAQGRFRWPVWVGAGALAILSVVGILTFLLPNLASGVTELVPIRLEENIGEQSEAQLLELFSRLNKDGGGSLCTHADAQEILDKRAAEIALVMESPFPIQVRVVRLPIANALTLPGGRIVILSGLIDEAKSGDEVIGVLAHEIAHAVRRDPLRVSIKQTGTAVLVSLLIGDIFGGALLSGLVSGIIENGYSRDAERASDFLAVTALNQLGLTARPLARFVGRIGKENPYQSAIPEFLQTHPAGENREREIIALSQGHRRSMTGYEWKTLQSICD